MSGAAAPGPLRPSGVVPVATGAAATVVERYDLGAVRHTRVLAGGMFLKPLLITTDGGRFVLRGHTFRPTEADFRFQAEALAALAAQGVRCPQVVRDREGSLGQEREGAFWALHEYFGGELYDWPTWSVAKEDSSFVRGLGAQVAVVHNALAAVGSLSGEPTRELSPLLPPIQFAFLDVVRQQWEQSLDDLDSEGATHAARTAEAFLAARAPLAAHWQWLSHQVDRLGIAQWSQQLVHGDVSPVNLVFDPSGRRFSLIDWDCLHWGVRLYDALGDILSRPPVEAAGEAKCERDKVQLYLEAYSEQAVPEPGEDELRAAPVFCLARQLEDLRQRLHVLSGLPLAQDAEYARLVGARIRVMDDCRAWSLETLE